MSNKIDKAKNINKKVLTDTNSSKQNVKVEDSKIKSELKSDIPENKVKPDVKGKEKNAKKSMSSDKKDVKKGEDNKQVLAASSKDSAGKKTPKTKKKVSKNTENKTKNAGVDRPKPPPVTRGANPRNKRKHRKPRISAAELKRRQVKEWLSVKGNILGERSYLKPPAVPFFMQCEQEFIKAHEIAKRERENAERLEKIKKEQEKTRKEQSLQVNQRYKDVCKQSLERALEIEQQKWQKIKKVEEERARRLQELQNKLHKDRMNEIKLAEQRRIDAIRKRRDEATMYRIFRNKYLTS